MRTDSPQPLELVSFRIIVLADPERLEARFIVLKDTGTWFSTPNTVSLAYHFSSTPGYPRHEDKGALSPLIPTSFSRIQTAMRGCRGAAGGFGSSIFKPSQSHPILSMTTKGE